jgi:hypothetical protein
METEKAAVIDPMLAQAGGGTLAAITGVSFLDPVSIRWMVRLTSIPALSCSLKN